MDDGWSSISVLLSTLVPYMAYLGAIAAVVSLGINLRDRRVRLYFTRKRGDWSGVLVRYVYVTFEVYNRSSRPNALREYEIVATDRHGNRIPLSTEEFNLEGKDFRRVMNPSPFAIPPYSGVLLHVGSRFDPDEFPPDPLLRITTKDLFGKKYVMEEKFR
jgi:hypothetical protein